MTLHQLRALLERALYADGPTPPHIARLGSTVTVENLARAYLPRRVYYAVQPRPATALCAATPGYVHHVTIHDPSWPRAEAYPDPLDLTDPGTVHAVKVALALALGLDPGPMGCAVSWIPEMHLFDDDGTGESRWGQIGWNISGVAFVGHDDDLSSDDDILAPAVAAEPDHVRALTLAVEHVLCSPA